MQIHHPSCREKQCVRHAEILSETEDRTVRQTEDENGRYIETTYRVFTGVEFIYGDAHIQSIQMSEREKASDSVFEITHCREGRMECSVDGELLYLKAGDLAIMRTNAVSANVSFPLRHYHGLTIRIDVDKTPKCFSCLLDDVTVQPRAIAEKYCVDMGGFVARANTSFEHIFSELYSVSDSIHKGYYKIKTLELLLFLSVFDVGCGEITKRAVSPYQVSLAKQVGAYLMKNMDAKITLEQIAGKFKVSATMVKNSFKAVYGVPFYAYIKTQKMESASYMLEYTDKTVLEIANDHGYDNASKFAVAFRSVKGISPVEYRANNSKKINI